MTHARILLSIALAALGLAVAGRLRGEGSPNPDYITPGDGWICQAAECRRPSDARTLHHGVKTERASLFTFARPDGSVEYVAAPSLKDCEEMRDLYLDLSPSPCGWVR